MTPSHPIRSVTFAAVALALLAAASPSFAGQRSRGRDRSGGGGGGGAVQRAVPRDSRRAAPPARVYRDDRGRAPYRGYGNYRSYGPDVRFNLYYGYPRYYGPYGYYGYYGPRYYGYYGPGFYGYSSYGYGYRYGYPGYVAVAPGRVHGGVRIDIGERDAEVYVDGYYAGIVDDFDGALQQLDLEPGPHHLEIVREGFDSMAFDVNVEPGRTVRYRTELRPLP